MNAPVVGFRPSDQRILTEGVTATFEGIVPDTQRTDGLFAESAEGLRYLLAWLGQSRQRPLHLVTGLGQRR